MDRSGQIITNLNIVYWNCNGLRSKTDELIDFLFNFDVDILLICETKLDATATVKIRGYDFINVWRSRGQGGGVGILIRESLLYDVINIPDNLTVEATGIKMRGSNTIIISAYSPPNSVFEPTDFDTLFNSGHSVLVAGDLNAKHTAWNCHSNNAQGKKLLSMSLQKNFTVQYPNRHTLYPYNNALPSTVDILLNKNVTNVTQLLTMNELDTDHLPVSFSLTALHNFKINRTYFNYAFADWTSFKSDLNRDIQINRDLQTTRHVDSAVANLTSLIQIAAKKNIKTQQITPYNLKLAPEIKIKIKSRNRLRKLWQLTGDDMFRTLKNKLTNEIKHDIKAARNNDWQNKLSQLNVKDKSLWKTVRSLKNTPHTIPVLHSATGLVFADEDKANALADHFEKTHNLTRDYYDPATATIVNRSIKKVDETHVRLYDIRATSPGEIVKYIKNTKSRKAPGPDKIQNEVLKHLPKKAICQLTYIFNACFKLSYFPRAWKSANVLAFPKAGKDRVFPQNYRPISLLPTLSKVFEKIILNRIKEHETAHKQLISEQFGFRSNHSTTEQLARLTDFISTGYNINKCTAVLLLDIEKAFDTVWHKGLIHKLVTLNIKPYIIKIIKSYLSHRTFTVVHKNCNSSRRNVVAGVPQGSLLGPQLFLYYINDIPKSAGTELALFADDTALYTRSWSPAMALSRLQTAIDYLEPYYLRWKIKINTTKTKLVLFRHRR